MILIRANNERQILVIRATLVSAPPSECLEIRLWWCPLFYWIPGKIDKPKVVRRRQSQNLMTWFSLKSQCPITPHSRENFKEAV